MRPVTPPSHDPDSQALASAGSRLSFERLRERTDELELIISGLTTVALFALPGWMLERYALLYPKLPMPAIAAAELSMAMLAIPMIGVHQTRAHFNFDTFGNQDYISDEDLASASDSLRSRYYESRLHPRDLRRMGPVIPDPVVRESWVPLFLPYFPVLDDPVLRQLCGHPRKGPAADCVRQLWQVELNGKPVPLDGFVIAQRSDLGFRGLQGFIDLSGATPGPQRLHVVWNPQGSTARRPDDYLPARIEHHIPFLLAPEWGNDAPQSGD